MTTVEVTGVRQRQAWRDRRIPPVEQIRPWLWSIPVPMPGNPLRYVLVYAFDSDGELVLLDTGWSSPAAWQSLNHGLDQIGASVANVRGVLISHAHFDHYGLAGRIREESGAWIAMHHEEAASLRPGRSPEEVRASYRGHLVATGADSVVAERLAGGVERWRAVAELPIPDRTFDDGDVVLPALDVRAVWTPGHTPGHSCFYLPSQSLLFSGDHVLPRITPNISAYDADVEGGPLAEYLRSLDTVCELDVDEVMPGHEYRFSGLRERVRELQAHHVLRLREVESQVRAHPGATTWQLAERLHWSRPWDRMGEQQWPFAVGETLSHLELLRHEGSVRCTNSDPLTWRVVDDSQEDG